jgi:hypothetical protein
LQVPAGTPPPPPPPRTARKTLNPSAPAFQLSRPEGLMSDAGSRDPLRGGRRAQSAEPALSELLPATLDDVLLCGRLCDASTQTDQA